MDLNAIKNASLEEIEARIAEIPEEIRAATDEEALTRLETEASALRERREKATAFADRRKQLVDDVESRGKLLRVFGDDEQRKVDVDIFASAEYRSAWNKHLMGQTLNEGEKRALISGTTSVGHTIPTETYNRIVEHMVQTAPLLGEITLLQIPGYVKLPVEGTVNAAAIHTEGAELDGSADTISQVSLGTYELMKLLPISGTVQAMAIPAFETWIVNNMSKSLARLMESYIITGTGSNEPTGVEKANTWSDTSNAVQWASSGAPTAAELYELASYLKGGYVPNAKFLMNNRTLFGAIMPAFDGDKFPVLVRDGSIWRLLGYPVIFSDYIANGTTYFGDWSCIYANMAQPVTIEANAASGFRSNTLDYRGVCMFDCKPALGEAFVKGATAV